MPKKNPGKVFEKDFADSIPDYCMVHRLKDSAQSYKKTAMFAWDNPCDYFVYDSTSHLFYPIECKSTKSKSMSIQVEKEDGKSSMIKKHQIDSLSSFSKYDGVVPCFILNFRNDEDNLQRTYYMHIDDFNKFLKSTPKKSINEIDIILNGGSKIVGEIKRVHYKWDIASLFDKISKKN